MSKKINQTNVRKVFSGVGLVAVLGLSYSFVVPGSEGEGVLGFGLLAVLGISLAALLIWLIFLVKGQSIARRTAWVAALSIAALAYYCTILSWSAEGANVVAYALLVAVLYVCVMLFSLWFIYALQGWMKILAVLMALLAAVVAGWNMFAVALLGSS